MDTGREEWTMKRRLPLHTCRCVYEVYVRIGKFLWNHNWWRSCELNFKSDLNYRRIILFRTRDTPRDDGWCIGRIGEKKLLKSWIQLRRRSEGSFRDRQLHPSRDDNARAFSFFFLRPPVLSYESLFHIIPIIHAAPRSRSFALSAVVPTAQRALISGSLVGYSQKTFRKKFPRHFVEPPETTHGRMLSIFFLRPFILSPLSLSLSFSPRCHRRTGSPFRFEAERGEGLKKGRYRSCDGSFLRWLLFSWFRFVNFLICPR